MSRTKKEFNKEEAKRLYVDEKQKPAVIAKTVGVCTPIIVSFLKDIGVYQDGRATNKGRPKKETVPQL